MIRREPQIIFNINSAFAKTVMGKLLITKGIYLAIVSLIIMATVLVCVADASGSSTSVCGNGGRGIFNLGGPTCKRSKCSKSNQLNCGHLCIHYYLMYNTEIITIALIMINKFTCIISSCSNTRLSSWLWTWNWCFQAWFFSDWFYSLCKEKWVGFNNS